MTESGKFGLYCFKMSICRRRPYLSSPDDVSKDFQDIIAFIRISDIWAISRIEERKMTSNEHYGFDFDHTASVLWDWWEFRAETHTPIYLCVFFRLRDQHLVRTGRSGRTTSCGVPGGNESSPCLKMRGLLLLTYGVCKRYKMIERSA